DAGAVRFRPMMLTAAAVIVGSAVILFDPIFQGLAISLMAGEVASLFLSRMTVPILFYLSERKNHPELILEEDLSLNEEVSPADVFASEEGNGNQEASQIGTSANPQTLPSEQPQGSAAWSLKR
ncbi:MAG TPA: hypothetical protein VJM12_14760, partial [Pyrinomonadaceae bacterium]|nr:hypothetical protein [Pyrinomonadaceae bacterium]